jgi:tRNA pseudouridine55 synthase
LTAKRVSRRVDGVLVLDKPPGLSSNAALQRVKALFGAAKAGHTGSLDPLATGVLPICMGEATKLSQFLLDADKEYLTTIQLGVVTDTGDAAGQVVRTACTREVSASAVDVVLARFAGRQAQVPPMYSALKRNGVPLYALARKGQEVPREARTIWIHRMERVDFTPGEAARLTLRMRVSKGTYVRVIAEDIGAALGCGAHVAALHRTAAGGFTEQDAFTMERLESARNGESFGALDALLLAPVSVVSYLPELQLSDTECRALLQGQRVLAQASTAGLVRAADSRGVFCGIAELSASGELRARRMMSGMMQTSV